MKCQSWNKTNVVALLSLAAVKQRDTQVHLGVLVSVTIRIQRPHSCQPSAHANRQVSFLLVNFIRYVTRTPPRRYLLFSQYGQPRSPLHRLKVQSVPPLSLPIYTTSLNRNRRSENVTIGVTVTTPFTWGIKLSDSLQTCLTRQPQSLLRWLQLLHVFR